MTVAELMEVLETQEPNATVVLWDNTAYGGHLAGSDGSIGSVRACQEPDRARLLAIA